MIKLISILLLALATDGLTLGQVSRPAKIAPDTLIALQRGACEDRCAVYRLMVFADGTVIYQGQYNVKKTGLVKSGISPEALEELLQELASGGFFQFSNKYGFGDTKDCKSLTAGEPTAILSVSSAGRSKTVLHQHGCTGAVPDRLTALEDKVDQAVGAVHWIK